MKLQNYYYNTKFAFVRRSLGEACKERHAVLLGDTMGELGVFYQASDIAFVGGSLVTTGGHNLLEPAAVGKPIITGPHVYNFKEIAELLDKAQALKVVNDADELAATLAELFLAPATCALLGERALAVVLQNKGATSKVIELLKKVIHLQGVDKYEYKDQNSYLSHSI